ncbi:MAG: hydroxyacid dehydrogenase [Proteobacteria bacterium]|nr:MAG: hydroxyacid dehydrogenase [Pseudomonadota bacterium]
MAKARLLITDGLSPEGLKNLEDSGLFEISFHKAVDKEALKAMLPGFEAIVIRSATKLTKELIDAGPQLKVIMRAGAGVDNVDVAHASTKKILVLNCPGTNNNAVAELTLGFLFSLMRELPRATNGMKQGLWEKKELVGSEAAGRSIGILGFGAIGNLVGRACQALGMDVVAFDPKGEQLKTKAEYAFVKKWATSVDEVFASSDVVTVHMPLMDSTKNSIGAAQFAKMKKGSYFINASRGGIANEAALLEALNNGTLAGAALDVFDQEPTPAGHPLVSHAKVICSPHIGAATKEAQHKVGLAAAKYLIQYYQEGTAPSAVNG